MFIWAILSLIALNAQNTFQIDKSYLDSTSFDKYKTFIVSENFDIDFIGRQIPAHRRFTIDAAQLNLIEQAIKTEYYTARVKQIDSQWAQMETYKESYDWDLAMKQRTKQRPKMLKVFKKEINGKNEIRCEVLCHSFVNSSFLTIERNIKNKLPIKRFFLPS